MSKTFNIEPIESGPKAFIGWIKTVNKLIKVAKLVETMKGDGNINVAVSYGNILFSLAQSPNAASEFDEIEVTLCVNGSPVTGTILFKEDEE